MPSLVLQICQKMILNHIKVPYFVVVTAVSICNSGALICGIVKKLKLGLTLTLRLAADCDHNLRLKQCLERQFLGELTPLQSYC